MALNEFILTAKELLRSPNVPFRLFRHSFLLNAGLSALILQDANIKFIGYIFLLIAATSTLTLFSVLIGSYLIGSIYRGKSESEIAIEMNRSKIRFIFLVFISNILVWGIPWLLNIAGF